MWVFLFYLLVLYLQLHQLLCLIVQLSLKLWQSVNLQLLLQQLQVAKLCLHTTTTFTLLFTPVHTAGDNGICLHVLCMCVEGMWIYLALRSKAVSSALSSCSFTWAWAERHSLI